MDFFNAASGLRIFTALTLLYALWVMYYLFSTRREKGKGEAVRPQSRPPGRDIMGKSTFDRRHLRPQAAISPEREKGDEKEAIFVLHDAVTPSARIPDEELEEAFSAAPDENPPLDIYYPLADETDEADEADDDFAGEDEEVTAAPPSGGTSFEELEQAVRTAVHPGRATDEEQAAAAKTLLDIRPSDMFEQLIRSAAGREETVGHLMQKHLDAYAARKDEERETIAQTMPAGRKAPTGFDICEYV
jgi:hypothetical protein